MADYPDWSRLVQLIGSDIKVPIDVQGQFITLDINILSTTADIDVNINAQNVELDIDLTAQHVGLYLQPEWAALQGDDKNFRLLGSNMAAGGEVFSSYVVPAGTTLYICGASFAIWGWNVADFNNNQIGQVRVYNLTDSDYLISLGGNGGGSTSLPKPIAIVAGKTMRITAYNYAGHAVGMELTVWGYEVTS